MIDRFFMLINFYPIINYNLNGNVTFQSVRNSRFNFLCWQKSMSVPIVVIILFASYF